MNRSILAVLLTLFPAILLSGNLRAADSPLDLRVLIDVSEQMNAADPQGLRARAVELLLQMLPESGYAGIWTYAGAVNMIAAHGRSNQLWKKQATLIAAQLPAVGANANLPRALAAATWDSAVESNRQRHLILITDGGLRTGQGAAADEDARREILSRQLPALRAAGYRLHVLQLPGDGDTQFLRAMSRDSNGLFRELTDLQQLQAAVLLLLDGLVQPGQLPVAADQGFLVEPGLNEVTVLRVRRQADDELTLTGPDGRAYTRQTANVGFRWHVGVDYDLVTFDKPQPGRWFFSPDTGQESRILTTGNLRPNLDGLPAMVFPGELKNFRLDLIGADGIPITDPDFLNLLELDAELVSTDAVRPIALQRDPDGHYQLQMLAADKQGDYTVRLRLSAPTFARISEIPFSIRNPISLQVVPASDGGLIWLAMNAGDVVPGLTRVSAVLTRPMLGAETQEAERFPGGLWKLALNGAPGVVEVALGIYGKQLNGNDFSIQMKPVVVTLPVTMGRSFNFDLQGTEISAGALALPVGSNQQQASQLQPAVAALPLPAELTAAPVELPLLFVAVLAPVNLLLGFAVFLLLIPPAGAGGFLARVGELEEMLPQPVPQST